MSAITTPAYLIHKQAQGDTSLYLYCLTREKGLLAIHYRGGRVVKKRAPVESFASLWCVLQERRGVYYLNALEAHEQPWALSGVALFSALYLNELLFYTLPHEEPEEALYVLYEQTLKCLSESKEIPAIEVALRRFEIQLLKSVGYGLTLLHEADTHNRIEDDKKYCYQAGRGFSASGDGFKGCDLLAIAKDKLETKEQLVAAKRILRIAIEHLLAGRKLASRDLLKFKRKGFDGLR